MKRVLILAWVGVGLILDGAACAADGPLVLDVWPGKVVGDHGQIGPERVRGGGSADGGRNMDHKRDAADNFRISS